MTKIKGCGVALVALLGCDLAVAAPAPAPPPDRAPPSAPPTAKRPAATARPAAHPSPARPALPAPRERERPVRTVPAEAVTPPPRDMGEQGLTWERWALWEGLAGFGAAAVMVPATLALGQEIGKHPSNYLAAALPTLLMLMTLPPAAVTVTEYFLGNHLKKGQMRFHPAFWTAIGVQLVTMVVAIAARATTHDLSDASAFAAIDSVILPGTVTLMLYLTRRKPATKAATAVPTFPTTGGRARLLSLQEERWLARRHHLQPTAGEGVLVNVLRMRF